MNEIQLYSFENVVFDRDKYQRLIFPIGECSKCGRRYNLIMSLEHIGTNPNRG